MRIDRFTQKGQEAVLESQHLAQEYNHPAIEPEHLLKALIEQEGGAILSWPKIPIRSGISRSAPITLTGRIVHPF